MENEKTYKKTLPLDPGSAIASHKIGYCTSQIDDENPNVTVKSLVLMKHYCFYVAAIVCKNWAILSSKI